jgi:hypothetical protein
MMRSTVKMIKEFEFVDAGRKFFCSVEVPRHVGMPPWWWFRLDTGESTRYAPFEASPNDTIESVQERIVAYYEQLLAIEARPVHQRPAWRKPEPAAAPLGEALPAPSSAVT